MANRHMRQLIRSTKNVNLWIYEKFVSDVEVVAEQNCLEQMKKEPADDGAFQKQVQVIFKWKANLSHSMRKLRQETKLLEEFLGILGNHEELYGTDELKIAVQVVKKAKKVLTDSN